jgi:hypothetical protein
MDRRSRALCAAAVATGLGACSHGKVTVGALDVSPRLSLPPQGRRVALDLAPVTPDAIRFATRGFPVVEVSALHSTLRRAFERAFAPSFTAAAGPGDATLLLEVTALDFVTTRKAPPLPDDTRGAAAARAGAEIVLAHGTAVHPPHGPMKRSRYARFRFTASLRQRGAEVARLSGFAIARRGTQGSARSIEESLASAVSDLYQQIGRQLFERSLARAGSYRL